MASSFEKSVKGATKIKAAPPKTKYIEHILIATHSGEAGVAEVFRALQNRLRDSTWTVVFKSLITVHLMIREGSPDATLAYLGRHKNMLAISSFSDDTVLTEHGKVQTQGRNIRHYTNYLSERARGYRDTKCDFVQDRHENRLEKMTVDKGLLRETEAVQHQVTALLKCDVLDNEPENEITITVFRMLVTDLLALFQVMNKAMINILGHFFEMSRPDAERALAIYKTFTKQTDFVVAYLNTAREYQLQTRIEVPKLKHAPINLGKQLEDYLMDPDFEINSRQYLAEQESKKGKLGTNGASKVFSTSTKSESESRAATGRNFPDTQPTASKPAQVAKGPDPDLIDFFDSIEQNQQPMAAQPSQGYQQQGLPQYSNGTPYQMQSPQFQNGFNSQSSGFQNPTQFQQQNQQPFNAGSQQPQEPFGTGIQQPQQPFITGAQQPQEPFSTGIQQPQQPQQPFNTGAQQPQQHQQSQPLQTNFTGAGFGGYTPQSSFQPGGLQSIPQDSAVSFQQQPPQQLGLQTGAQNTNPFRQSMIPQPTGVPGPSFPASPPITSPLQRQSTNPFAKHSPQPTQPFSPPPDQQFQHQQPQATPLQPMATGTNPFARNIAMNSAQRPQTSAGLVPQPTGSTNPFRQSQFVNTATGMGWQNNQQPMGGGLDNLESVPVFPRPAQQQPWQQ